MPELRAGGGERDGEDRAAREWAVSRADARVDDAAALAGAHAASAGDSPDAHAEVGRARYGCCGGAACAAVVVPP